MIFLRKSQRQVEVFKGEITAFLTLLFLIMLSIVGTLLQGTRFYMRKMENRAATSLALESTFAEYHNALLEQYEIFAKVGCSEEIIQNRLLYYGTNLVECERLAYQVLTDDGGNPFYNQAVGYMKDWLGIQEDTEGVTLDTTTGENLENEQEEVSGQMDQFLEEHNATLPKDKNPMESKKRIEKLGVLQVLVENPQELSNCYIDVTQFPSVRNLKKGNYHEEIEDNAVDKAFFTTYVLAHFSSAIEKEQKGALHYEIEYLLGGCSSDRDNLESVCKKILLIRMAINYAYLQTSQTRKTEAEVLAASLCTIIALPELTEVAKQAILLGWAYGESVVDVRVLLKGEKVPLVKNDDNWQLQLEQLANLGTSQEIAEEKPSKQGMSYEDYLKGLLLLEQKETLCMRSLDLIEANLHIRTDECMTKVIVDTKHDLGLGIQKTYRTVFGYQ